MKVAQKKEKKKRKPLYILGYLLELIMAIINLKIPFKIWWIWAIFFPMKDHVYIGPNHILEVEICWNFAQKNKPSVYKVKQMAKRVTKMRAHMRW